MYLSGYGMEKYAIGIIASPRQPGYRYKKRGKNEQKAIGYNTKFFQRGTYQFTGHTALYVRQGTNFLLVSGLVPNKRHLYKAMFSDKNVEGHWQEDMQLFDDPTSITFEVTATKETAENFLIYFENTIKRTLTSYKLRPGSFADVNCVHGAIIGFANFIYENIDDFPHQKQLAKKLDELLESTSKSPETKQGNLMQTISKLNEGGIKKENVEMLLYDLEMHLKDELSRLVTDDRTIRERQKYQIIKQSIETVKRYKHKDEAGLIDLLKKVDMYTSYKKKKADPRMPESQRQFGRFKRIYNINLEKDKSDKSYRQLRNSGKQRKIK